ncbi:MAG TPA: acyl-CoA dehydrogenase family protein [Acidimicrobiales bacterium]|nr:acyl-CoA dehydrogenase family protein [Acidimicrobiales bacterium]
MSAKGAAGPPPRGAEVDLERTPEQETLAETVARFLADNAPVRPYVRSMLADPAGFSPEVWKGLAALGLCGLMVPEAWGGSGMGLVDMGVVLEELGRAVHPGPFLASAVAATRALCLVGREDEAAALLGPMAEGSTVATVALLEPGSRWRWQARATRAEAGPGGWRLSGAKAFVPDASAADLILVPAADGKGVGLFAVEAGAEGLGVEPLASVDQTRRLAHLSLDRVPARRLGQDRSPAEVARALDQVADAYLVAMAADGLGAAEQALQMAVAYATDRVQFGVPIGSFQAVQHLCSDMLQWVELARAGVSYALWAADRAGADEAHRAATMAKAYAADALPRVGASAIQVHGGIGFTWEHDVHLYYKRLLGLQQAHGPASDHLEELARLVMDAGPA